MLKGQADDDRTRQRRDERPHLALRHEQEEPSRGLGVEEQRLARGRGAKAPLHLRLELSPVRQETAGLVSLRVVECARIP